LKINGSFDSLVFRDDPSMRKSEVKGLANGKVIKSEMKIENAKVEVKDLESFEFIRPDPDAGRKADLKKLKVNQISITDIQATAKIWDKSPIFGWLMGKFPKIGTVAGKLPDQKVSSEIRLESLDTQNGEDGRTTQITNFLIQLFELGGRDQKAKFKLPSL